MQDCCRWTQAQLLASGRPSTLSPNIPQFLTNMDPQHNIFKAFELRIDKGIAPVPIIAAKYVNDLDAANE